LCIFCLIPTLASPPKKTAWVAILDPGSFTPFLFSKPLFLA
jgi:hypothetical protein